MKTHTTLTWLLAATTMAFASSFLNAQTTWSPRTAIPTPREGLGYCALSNKLYVFGGEYQLYGYVTNRNEAYDPISNTWSVKSAMPQPLYGSRAVATTNEMLLIGGRPPGPPWYSITNVSAYNPATDSWSAKAPMAIARDSLVAVEVGSLVYAIGGYDQGSSTRLKDVEIYDPAQNTWSTGPAMLTARSDAAGAVVGNVIYVFGGMDNSGNALDTVEALDTITGTWSTKASMTTARNGHVSVALNGLIYVTGGDCSSEVDIYYPAQDRWYPGQATPAAGATSGSAIGALSLGGGSPDTLVIATGEHVYCSGGGYLVGDVIALSPPTIFGINIYAGLTLTGPVGSTNRVEYKTNLADTTWTTLADVVLPSSPYLFFDSSSPASQHRFYRAVPQP